MDYTLDLLNLHVYTFPYNTPYLGAQEINSQGIPCLYDSLIGLLF